MPDPMSPQLRYYLRMLFWVLLVILIAIFAQWCPSDCDPPPPPSWDGCAGLQVNNQCATDENAPSTLDGTCLDMAGNLQCTEGL